MQLFKYKYRPVRGDGLVLIGLFLTSIALQFTPGQAAPRTTPASQATTHPAEYLGFLKRSELQVHVWTLEATERQIELGNKMQAAIANNQEWWLDFVKKAEPGKPLPYHENCGLTRPEFEEFMQFAGNRKLHITSEATIRIKSLGHERYELTGTGSLKDLAKIVIDEAILEVKTPFGNCQNPEWLPRDPGRNMGGQGLWEGWTWKQENIDINTLLGSSVKLTIGRLPSRNESLLFYDGTMRASADEKPSRVRITCTWP